MHLFDNLDPSAYALPAAVREQLLSPALVIWLDRVRHNLAVVTEALGGDVDRWRPHVKTTKTPAIFRELARAGVRHFKCATPREAATLAETLEAEGATGVEILLAYPLLGPNLARLAQVARAHPSTRIDVLVEDAAVAAQLPEPLGAYLDLNPGMNRTGVPLANRDEVLHVARAAGQRLRGVHAYDGHRHEEDPDLRAALVRATHAVVAQLVTELRAEDLRVQEVITAGTPAFTASLTPGPLAELEGVVHRLSPGTVVLHDARSAQQNPDLALQPAATLFTRVVSHPDANLVTCDAGSKSLAAEAGDPSAVVLGHPELVAQCPSEEHLPLRVTSGPRPPRGTELLLIPRHVCPTVNLAEQVWLMDGSTSLGPAPVSGRAHELQLLASLEAD